MAEVKLEYIAPGINKVIKDRGFGDTVARFTKATGVKTFVDKISEVTGVPCGCSERQEKLNKIIPYK